MTTIAKPLAPALGLLRAVKPPYALGPVVGKANDSRNVMYLKTQRGVMLRAGYRPVDLKRAERYKRKLNEKEKSK